MKKIHYFIIGLSVLALAACDNETTSTLGAAALGAGIGMAVSNDDDKRQGALIGAGLGTLLANEMQKQSQSESATTQSTSASTTYTAEQSNEKTNPVIAAHNFAVQRALESGSPEKWSYGKSSGTIYPTGSYTEYGLTCRGYDSLYTDGNVSGNLSGQACRQPNGFWKEA